MLKQSSQSSFRKALVSTLGPLIISTADGLRRLVTARANKSNKKSSKRDHGATAGLHLRISVSPTKLREEQRNQQLFSSGTPAHSETHSTGVSGSESSFTRRLRSRSASSCTSTFSSISTTSHPVNGNRERRHARDTRFSPLRSPSLPLNQSRHGSIPTSKW